ncbi:MAG: hypothetical protein OEV42_20060 [Deltaproteobacteria bacterium]|nr:hypothetical protein [Deltaproteobacteria bacterium]
MKQHKTQREHQVNTPLGTLSFCADVEQGELGSSTISSQNIKPSLPGGMSVENCVAVIFKCKSLTKLYKVNFSCAWVDFNENGYGASGEGLEAWEWEASNKLVLIGTEDNDWASQRIKLKEVSPESYSVSMSNNRISIEIDSFPTNQQLTLHYVVSWNSAPEEVDCSCWYAVDIPHEKLLSECK